MDVYKILKESASSLYPEDLDFFETELATGGPYEEPYRKECLDLIQQLRKWMKSPHVPGEEPGGENKLYAGGLKSLGDIAPKGANPALEKLTPAELICSEIAMIRKDNAYKTRFKEYVQATASIDAAFVDQHSSFFQPWELEAILMVRQMGETFLEKYFGVLNPEKIARYQLFSEAFFMKHWPDLDPVIVLEQGKNPWRKKENRSKQLDVFLRLKGVKI